MYTPELPPAGPGPRRRHRSSPKPAAPAAEDSAAGAEAAPAEAEEVVTWRRQPSVERFVQAALGRAEPLVKPEETLNVQRVMDALYQSAATGRLVEITD